MTQWSPQDWGAFFLVAGPAALAFYMGVVKPLLAQLTDLVKALKENTASTNTSARAMTTTATAVDANTQATQQVAAALPGSPVTVNVVPPSPQ